MNVESGTTCQPLPNPFVLMRGVIIADDVQFNAGEGLADCLQEIEPYAVAMPRVQVSKDGAIGDVHRGKQCRGSIACVIMIHCLHPPGEHRQASLCAVERLDFTLLVHAQYDRMFRRAEIHGHYIIQFLFKHRVIRIP